MRVTLSQILSMMELLQWIKRGHSDQTLDENLMSSSSLNLFVILLIPTRTAAAFPLPPPSPAPTGILFFIKILIFKLTPHSLRKNSDALQARFSFPLGISIPVDSRVIPSPSSTSILTSSNKFMG